LGEDQAKNGLTSPVVVAVSITIGLLHEGGLSSLTTDACSHPPCCVGDQPVGVGYGGATLDHQIGKAPPVRRAGDRDKHMGISPARFVALATRAMPWKRDA
jgi:hypothetical protein